MGTTRAAQAAQATPWTCGLTLEDFEVPSTPTPVAQAAQLVTAVTLDLATAMERGDENQLAHEVGFELHPDVLDLAEAANHTWAIADAAEGLDFDDRKVLWPYLDPDDYRPASSVQQRIEDNLAAIRLVKALAQEQRSASPDEMTTLLRYSGWGGASRVFAPDGSTPQPLAALRDQLQAEVDEREYTAMQASVNTSFYTPPQLVQAIWKLVERLGFKGGRVIEPAAGPGHMIAGMPQAIARKSSITAVELDPTTAKILEANFAPYGLQVQACGLEEAKLPVGFFDLCITNAPFGDFRTNDTSKSPYADWLIHNWFLGKSLELVRPGGLVAMITSKGSLDSKTDTHRRWLGAHAELVAAFRLPSMAFQAHANTEAVTDIVVLKRREMPDYATTVGWLRAEAAVQELFAPGEARSVTAYSRQTGRNFTKEATVNSFYNRHPDAMVGRLKWTSTQHGQSALTTFDGGMQELATRLNELIERLPEGVYQPTATAEMLPPAAIPMARYANLDAAMPGSFVLQRGRICICEGDEVLDVDSLYTGTARKRLLGMMEIRKAATAVIEHQAKSEDDAELRRLQGHLNRTYDAFVATMGPVCTTANSRVMRSDPNWPLLLALEIWDDETETASKADIFSKRTVGVPEVPQTVDNVKDALLISLALHGRVNLQDMAARTGKAVRDVIEALTAEALAFRDPALGRWVPADEYLSGNIRDKLNEARAAGPAYVVNVPALEAVLPADLGPLDVEARLGAPWIPCEVVVQFATELVNDSRGDIEVSFDKSTATWSVKGKGHSRVEWIGDRALQTMKWGTTHRCALTLIEAAANQQPPTITEKVDDRQVVNAAATFAAREKWQAIRDEFRMWAYRDEARRDRLLRIYNDLFNQLVPRNFDGSHLHLPGLSKSVVPYPHQKNAIWRILVAGNTLLAHCVGAGKSLEMIAASMELRRLGKARKPCHVVPNHLLEAYAGEFLRFYPQAKVLMASKDDLCGDKRRAFAARIATGDWDAVVMTQSTFERLMLSPEKQQAFIESMLAEARTMLSLTEDRGAKRSIKEIEKRMKDYEAKIKRLADAKADDQSVVWFDELGVDWLLIDEAHSLKNLGRMSKMPRIAGLPNTSSQRAFDAFMKTRLIMEERGGLEEGVTFATATPISNSVAECHVMQLFLQPETLKRYGLYEFDAWSASFGEAVTGIELSPDGSGFRTTTRYARFTNVAELMSIFRGVADIQTKRMLNLPTPRIEGGKPQVMVSQPSDALLGIVTELVARADKIRHGGVKPEEDNMLAITNDGRRAALDVRLVDPTLPGDPNGKLPVAAANIHRLWVAGAANKESQLVFCDIGTPGAAGFSVYDELRKLLTCAGIPNNEIEFMQDHDSDTAKAKLFKRVRDGAVRVLIGSTQKMGTGTNVQKRLKGLHQLDAPWRPADVEQRDGRADRQGNECESIELWRYVTERSFDSYSWNLLDVKARFIEQLMTAGKGMRSVEDIGMTALSYAEIKAISSGNPLVLEKATVDAQVQKLGLAYSQWEDDRWRMGRRKAALQTRVGWINLTMPAIEQDAKLANQLPAAPSVQPQSDLCRRAVAVSGSAEEAIGATFRAMAGGKLQGTFAQVDGFRISAERNLLAWDIVVQAPHSGLRAVVERPHMNEVVAVGEAVLETIRGVAEDPSKLRREHADKAEELASIEKMLQEDFAQRDALVAARSRQAEIEAMLDLDKDTAGAAAMETEAA